jgi:predicted DNA-binding protein with PD1-like motif
VVCKAVGELKRVVAVRLAPGSDLLTGIESIARDEEIRSGVILSCAAFLEQAAFRNVRALPASFPITDEIRFTATHHGPIEVLSLSGNISERNNEFFLHAHIAVSLGHQDGRSFGGHLVVGNTVFSTAGVIIGELVGISMQRRYDCRTKNEELMCAESDRTHECVPRIN